MNIKDIEKKQKIDFDILNDLLNNSKTLIDLRNNFKEIKKTHIFLSEFDLDNYKHTNKLNNFLIQFNKHIIRKRTTNNERKTIVWHIIIDL